MRIAHISDLHFSTISYGIGQLFSKRWLGNLNLIFNRNQDFSAVRPYSLIEVFKKQGITDVIISGDLTTTSSKKEYKIATDFVAQMKKEGINIYLIPGNHDHYTKKAYKKQIFYRYFPSYFNKKKYDQFNLEKDGVTLNYLGDKWWLIGLDTTIATPLTSANGYFSIETEKNLQEALSLIPKEEKILLVNHFPFFQHDKPNRRLKRGTALQKIIQDHPNIQLYFHGHTHRRCIADLRENQLPIVIDSGSTAHYNGSWNCIDLTATSCCLSVYKWHNKNWDCTQQANFTW